MESLIFAHRGSSATHPENTLSSFQAAHELGADGIELDVQLTNDHVPVVIHDLTVNRTTNGKGQVKDYTFSELQSLDAGSWFDSKWKGERIPSLEEVLDWMKDTSLLLNIELKDGFPRFPELEKNVISLVRRFGIEDRVTLSSFNHYSLVEAKRLAPDMETAVLFMEGLYEPWDYARRIGASALHPYLPAAVPELINGALKRKMPVRVFTVNDEDLMKKFFEAGCSIFTDDPGRAVQLRRNMCEQ
ncbi:MAG: glycerophosphodiester phosphodiesterase [Bacillaceae bacterium]|nr:glycerophosphodiester phosphodiesterase [Bacillaceae bacterium]